MAERAKKFILAVLILLTAIASFVYYNNYKNKLRAAASIIKVGEPVGRNEDIVLSPKNTSAEYELNEAENEDYQKMIKLHVAGAVNKPGLYEAPDGSRTGDLIEIAGGSASDADLDRINLAAFVADGQQIYVPRISDEAGNGEGTVSTADSGVLKQVNINTANLTELMTLPGIGETLGGSIIKYRETNGYFKNPEDIKNVTGIGDKKYEAIMELITAR